MTLNYVVNKKEIIREAEKFMKENIPKSRGNESYLKHVFGARDYAFDLAKEYGADLFIVELAALLHDIGADAEEKHPEESAKMAKRFLSKFDIPADIEQKVIECIKNHAFWSKAETLEQQIVQDADGLIFLEDTYTFCLEKLKNEFPLEEARSLSIKKTKAMRDKILTEKGKILAEELFPKVIKYLESAS